MLKILCICACVTLCFVMFVPACAVAAEDVDWVRVEKEGVKLFSDETMQKVLFVLEKSYYLQIIGEEDSLYRVTVMENQVDFPTISGCVKKDQVQKCDKQPVPPYYPTVKVTVDSDSATIKLSPTPSAATVITVTNTQKMAYYGRTYYYDDEWYYVCFCGKFGYVSAESVTKPVISLHPTPLDQSAFKPTNPDTDDTPPNGSETPGGTDTAWRGTTAEIAMIVFVVLLAAGVCLALFLPGNLKKKGDVFDSEI